MRAFSTCSCRSGSDSSLSDLRVESVDLFSFRNHETWSAELNERLTILVGPNAAGKTNVLEAIMVSATGSSFRPFAWEDLVMRGREEARVSVRSVRDRAPQDISLRVTSAGSRTYSLNGRARRRLRDVTGRIPVVSFVPEDLGMSKGPAEERRAAVDALGDRLSPTYTALRLEFARALRQRNTLLRQGEPDSVLDPWDDIVARTGGALTAHRTRLVSRMVEPAEEAYRSLSGGEDLAIGYRASWMPERAGAGGSVAIDRDQATEGIAKALAAARAGERARGMTLAGPHRDDVVMSIGGHTARSHASQGQHRTIALAWKRAEVGIVASVSGVRPLLLLDDVMSELDEERRAELTSYVLNGPQSVVTTTNLSYFSDEMRDVASVVEMGRG